MSRFFLGDELSIDLESVSFVGADRAIIGGVMVHLGERVAFDLRKQFRFFREDKDKKIVSRDLLTIHRLTMIAVAAELVGSRIAQQNLSRPKLEAVQNGK